MSLEDFVATYQTQIRTGVDWAFVIWLVVVGLI